MLYLIVGAAYQNKRTYALRQYQQLAGQLGAGQPDAGLIDVEETAAGQLIFDGDTGDAGDLPASLSRPVIDHIHAILRRMPDDERLYQDQAAAWLDQLQQKLLRQPDQLQIIILDEIGSGIVPLAAADRLWRERCGRLGCQLAALAERVDRIWCGLPTVLKAPEKTRVEGGLC
jgi:hypothetical protein